MTPEHRRHWVRVVLSHPELTAAQKTVLIALETYADYETGREAYPGEENLAVNCGLTERAVRTALSRGRELGLIHRTREANKRAGLADEYMLVPQAAIVGLKAPVDKGFTGTAVPVDDPFTGTAVPVDNTITGTAVHDYRNRDDSSTGTAVPPTLPAPSNHQSPGGLRKSGTSPAREHVGAQQLRPTSRFCADHPRGTPKVCLDCANARTAFKAWQEAEAERDAAIAAADDLERRRLRKAKQEAIANCPNHCDQFGRLDEYSGIPQGHPLYLTHCDHRPMLRAVDG